MESLSLTHPVERWLLGFTAVAFLIVIYWKAGEPPRVRTAPATLVLNL